MVDYENNCEGDDVLVAAPPVRKLGNDHILYNSNMDSRICSINFKCTYIYIYIKRLFANLNARPSNRIISMGIICWTILNGTSLV